MKRKNELERLKVCPNCLQWQRFAASKGYFDCFNECAQRGFAPRRKNPTRGNAPYKRSGDMKGPRQMLSAPWAGEDSPRQHHAIPNPVDHASARELYLTIDCDGDLYRQMRLPIQKLLARKIGAGKYNKAQAVKAWLNLVDEGARKYNFEHGDGTRSLKLFDKPTRLFVAAKFARDFMDKYRGKEFAESTMELGKGKILNPAGACDFCRRKVFTSPVMVYEAGAKGKWDLCTKCIDKAKRRGAYEGPARENPLTVQEQAQLLRSAKIHAGFAKENLQKGNEKEGNYQKGYTQGLIRAAVRYGGTQSRRAKDVFGFQTPKWRASKTGKKILRIYRGNPAAPGKLIGPRCILIRTNLEEMKINTNAPIYGLKDGSVFIKGFFSRAPRGNVTRIEYMDDAKAAREGLRAKNVPWRHDFTAERKPISKVRGGLLIRAGKRPLWGMR